MGAFIRGLAAFTAAALLLTTAALAGGSFNVPGATDTSAATICSGTTTYLDGEGGCDDISGVYIGAATTDTLTNKTLDDDSNTVHAIVTDVRVRNVSGSVITAGSPVHITGYNSGQDRVTIDLADADDPAKMPAIGVAEEDIPNNANGHIVKAGLTDTLDTSAYTVGDRLYVSTTAGALTATRPTAAGTAVQLMAVVVRSHASLGRFVVVGAGRTNDTPNTIDNSITMASGTQILVDDGSGTAPGLSFKNATGSGFALSGTSVDLYAINARFRHQSNGVLEISSGNNKTTISPLADTAGSTVGYKPHGDDADTGITHPAADQIGISAGAVQAQIWEEASSQILIKYSVHAGLTANSGGGGVGSCLQLLSSFNEISTVAAGGDSVCVPVAVAGYPVVIINNGANAMDVYPNTDDNLGGGVNTAVSLAAGSNIRYFAYDATNWESI